MTREEVKDLLKFIIRKCDLIINNENYTADEYAQDKVEDIAEMCHRVLDGQFGEIVGPDTDISPNIDEAAEEYVRNYIPFDQCDSRDVIRIFKAGAEWMAGQGETHEHYVIREVAGHDVGPAIVSYPETFEIGEKVVVQIRKK